VALTARAMNEDMWACREAGMDGFVAKPLKREDLVQAINAGVGGAPVGI
jgi:CheY-like chemotaxis protein